MILIYVVEDIEEIRNGLVFLISKDEEFETAGFRNAEDLLTAMNNRKPDVILMDIQLPGMDGIECTKLIKQRYPEIQIMMVTVYEDDEKIFNALKAGASGYVLKKAPLDDMTKAIRDLRDGGAPMSGQIARKVVDTFSGNNKEATIEETLSVREREILDMLSRGLRNKEIAEKLFLSAHTVKAHIYNIYQKLHVRTRIQAINRINSVNQEKKPDR